MRQSDILTKAARLLERWAKTVETDGRPSPTILPWAATDLAIRIGVCSLERDLCRRPLATLAAQRKNIGVRRLDALHFLWYLRK